MSAESIIADIIDNANALMNSSADAATSYADAAQTAAGSVISLGAIPFAAQPSVTVPPFSPETDSTQELRGGFDEMFGQLYPDFDARFNAFMARFFPRVEACLQTSIGEWLCDTIQNGGTGIPADIENQIWERSRAREQLDSARQTEQIIENFAERGYTLPPGALFAATQDIERQLSQKISTHARDVAIKQAEIEIENIRFAITSGIQLRQIALNAVNDYLRAWLDTAKLAVEYANALVSAKLRLYDSTSAYYSALIAAARLEYDWGKDKADQTLRQQGFVVDSSNSNTAGRVNAAISAANAMGSIAAAVAAAQNSLANISNNTNIEA